MRVSSYAGPHISTPVTRKNDMEIGTKVPRFNSTGESASGEFRGAHVPSQQQSWQAGKTSQIAVSSASQGLSEDQKSALRLLKRTVHDSAIAVLIGNAGTGKTTLITQHLLPAIREQRICITAFTHRACGVVRDRLAGQTFAKNVTVKTLASLLGFREVHHSDSQEPIFEQVEDSQAQDFDVVIVDEASMVPQQYIKSLLDAARTYGVCLIFVGDDGQLPPVGNADADAPALKIAGAAVARLSKVHRNGGPILEAATKIRTAPKDTIPEWLESYSPEGNVLVHDIRYEMTEAVLAAVHREQTSYSENSFRVLCHTNKGVRTWNAICREAAMPNEGDPFVLGEKLVTRNALFDPSQAFEYGCAPLTGASAELEITSEPFCEEKPFFSLRPLRALLKEHKTPGLKVWYFTAFCDQTSGPIEVQALAPEDHSGLEKLMQLIKKRALKASSAAVTTHDFKSRDWWRTYYVVRNLFWHMAAPRYASTIHKSQGGQWESVFLDLPDMRLLKSKRPDEFQKLLYTGVTRAQRNLHILDS